MGGRLVLRVGLMAVVLVAFFVGLDQVSKVAWVGHTQRVVSFRVTDDKDGTAIPGASVRLTRGGEGDEPERKTNAAGEVDVEYLFQTCGTNSFFERHAVIEVGLVTVDVRAEGYHPMYEYLGTFTDSAQDLYGPPLPQIEIRLQRK
jgi:hypothetical protein